MGRGNLLWNTEILRKLYSELSCDVLDGSIRAQLGCNLIISHISPLYTILLLSSKICYCDLCRNFTVRINVLSMRQRYTFLRNNLAIINFHIFSLWFERVLYWHGFTLWTWCRGRKHYNDVIMDVIASQITSLTIVYSTVYSGADQRKYQRSA